MLNVKSLKVCFVGLGSIAKRHIMNLKQLSDEYGFELQIDALRRETGYDKILDVSNVYTSSEAMPNDYDVIFITNPTNLHLDTLLDVNDKGKGFFIEKPISSFKEMEKVQVFPYRNDACYYVACPLRYSSIIQFISAEINLKNIIGVRCICSSYLPEWRPETDYREIYSAHRDMGGGVALDLIHEWDYLIYLFGFPQKVSALMGKYSSLEIDSDDCAVYIAEYEDKLVELHLDYFGRECIRQIMLFTSEDTVICDFIDKEIRFLKENRVIDLKENRDDYQKRELKHFFDIFQNKVANDNHPIEAYKVMRVAKGLVG